MLKGLIRLSLSRVSENIGCENLNPIHCVEIANTKYPIYWVTFALGTILAQINHIRFIENIKIYWKKYEFLKPTIQYFRCQAHGHTSNCNKEPVHVKCAGQQIQKQNPRSSPTCDNCKSAHPTNYFECPASFCGQHVQNFPKRALPSTEHPPFYSKQNAHHLFPDSGKSQN